MRYGLAIFDFDGTLADSFPWFVQIVNQLARRHRFRAIEPHEIDLLRGWDARTILAHLGIPFWKVPWIGRDFRRMMAGEIDRIPLFPGAGETLRRVAERGTTIAVVTSNSAENVRRVLGPELTGLVSCLECGAGLFAKRAKLRRVLRATGTSAGRALCIGDEIRDLQAARAEGIPFGAVGWGYTRLDSLLAHSPEEAFTSFEELAERLA